MRNNSSTFLQLFRLALTIYILSMLPAIGHAQVFAPVGAQWIHQGVGSIFPIAEVTQSIGDTMVNSQSARIIRQEVLYDDGRIASKGKNQIVYNSGDSVFVLIKGKFRLLFDFSGGPGDTIKVIEEPFAGFFLGTRDIYEDFVYTIDSIKYEQHGEDSLRVQFISYVQGVEDRDLWGFRDLLDILDGTPGRIMEGVGGLSRGSMFGISSGTSFFIDAESSGLACYSDNRIHLNLLGSNCDGISSKYRQSSTAYELNAQDVMVFPNPANSEINISINHYNTVNVSISNHLGQTVLNRPYENIPVDLSNLNPGPYILTLIDQFGHSSSHKFIKQ